MQVTFLGTGSAMQTGDRMQTGLLLSSGRQCLLVDCGSGILHRLANTDVGYEGVGSILLTHHHLDHVADLLPLLKARWLAGEDHLEIVGPKGTKALVDGLLSVHDYLDGRVDLRIREVTAGQPFEVAGFRVEGHETRHSMNGLAYRFAEAVDSEAAEAADAEAESLAFVFSGDSEAFAGLARFADGCRVLAHDCSFPDGVDVSGHPTPTQLGQVLTDCTVDRLYLTHLYPHTDGNHEAMREAVAAGGFDGEIRVARDGLRVEF